MLLLRTYVVSIILFSCRICNTCTIRMYAHTYSMFTRVLFTALTILVCTYCCLFPAVRYSRNSGSNQAGTRLDPGWNQARPRLEPGSNQARTSYFLQYVRKLGQASNQARTTYVALEFEAGSPRLGTVSNHIRSSNQAKKRAQTTLGIVSITAEPRRKTGSSETSARLNPDSDSNQAQIPYCRLKSILL